MGGGEILVIFIAILMLFGAKNIPQIARNLGKGLETFRKASRGITDEIMRADVADEPTPSRLKSSSAKPAAQIMPVEPVEPNVEPPTEEQAGDDMGDRIKPAANAVVRDEKSE